jgi:nicotinamide mononucleotide (NMN) deamidase PncC
VKKKRKTTVRNFFRLTDDKFLKARVMSRIMSPKSEKNLETALSREARALARSLEARNALLVLAESCTGGCAAAALTEVPGISRFFCGSAVVYQAQTKMQWLGISSRLIREHSTESPEMSAALAKAVLRKTRQADLAAAITGDLGPLQGPLSYLRDRKRAHPAERREGRVFLALELRPSFQKRIQAKQAVFVKELNFSGVNAKRRNTRPASAQAARETRQERQVLASHALLRMVRELIKTGRVSSSH